MVQLALRITTMKSLHLVLMVTPPDQERLKGLSTSLQNVRHIRPQGSNSCDMAYIELYTKHDFQNILIPIHALSGFCTNILYEVHCMCSCLKGCMSQEGGPRNLDQPCMQTNRSFAYICMQISKCTALPQKLSESKHAPLTD